MTDYDRTDYGPGEGWSGLIEPVVEQAEEEGTSITQIKEKFGRLRIYAKDPSDELQEMIDRAEHESGSTCEICGGNGERRRLYSWQKTLCDGCHNKLVDEHERVTR